MTMILGFIICVLFVFACFNTDDNHPQPKTKEQEQIEKQQKQIEKQRQAWKRNMRYMK